FGLILAFTGQARAGDEPKALDLAFSLQEAFADAIKRAEPSLVSVIRFRHRDGAVGEASLDFQVRPGLADPRRVEIRVRPDGRIDRSWSDPSDPNFVPDDFGSGVIIDPAGLILTNSHVVENADELLVRLHNGKGLRAEIWAQDPRSDLAVLRVEATNLQPIPMGDASKVRKGHFVLSLGNPYATARDGRASASWGIISNIARRLPPLPLDLPPDSDEIVTLHHSATLLQTDSRLNYGTSGGALLNLKGEMIGLVTSLAAIRGFDQAAGYAIPLDESMRRILSVLREGREVEYGFLGIQPVPVPPDPNDSDFAGRGARVRDTFEGAPAFQGGILMEDVIVAVDGIPVHDPAELVLTVSTRFAGARVPITVVRNGKRLNLPVTLGKYPARGHIKASVRPDTWRGIRVDYATVLLINPVVGRERLRRVPEGGVLVIEVEPDSPAAAAGIELNDILTHMGKTRVRNPAEFYEAAKKAQGKLELTWLNPQNEQKKNSVSE
ncbi:MAG: trypsin-like peptidase domain-containing protein, partial [Planctomycetes bacterium]|nr:trypsin-like peptidase domain-containing protein [Planctomycetota bacterium]